MTSWMDQRRALSPALLAGVVSVCAGLLALMAMPAAARADVFSVSSVPVDAEAETAAAARSRAISQGQALALQRLVERLTLPEDRSATLVVDEATAQRLVAGLEVQEERAVGRRYFGRILVRFNPAGVRQYLRASGTPFVEARTRPILVLPLWAGDGEVVLWGDNPWLEAWRRDDQSGELAPILAPAGDGEDFLAINALRADALNLDSLAAIASRYGATRVVVTRANADSIGAVEVDLSAAGAIRPIGTLRGVRFDEAVRQISADFQTSWKRASVVRSTTVQSIDVAVLYGDLASWRNLQQAFGGASLVEEARLEALAPQGALMTLRYRGRLDQVASELREKGVRLEQDIELGWTAQLSRGARRWR